MELKDTIRGMVSKDYRIRFRAEYNQLRIRCEKLKAFLDRIYASRMHAGFDEPKHDCAAEDLQLQLEIMLSYKAILEKRAMAEGIEL